jgi:4-oxalocrotonate tautomerase
MVSIDGENMRGVTLGQNLRSGAANGASAGHPLTTEAVKDLAAGRKAA